MIIGDIADGLSRGVEATVKTVNEAFFEPTVRVGVTGLSRAGKTVFITSLAANLLNRSRMPALRAVAEGRVETVWLQPQPDNTVPRFRFEDHLGVMTGRDPHWPESTRGISELRLSFRVRPNGLLAGFQSANTVHMDIVDYPGEWLLDLALLNQSYRQWSDSVLARFGDRVEMQQFKALLSDTDPVRKLDEPTAITLAETFTAGLTGLRAAGLSNCTPGRFLMPGDLKGSPVLTFSPLPISEASRGSLAREFARRFEAYKSEVVKPFFREHFARIDRQVVLVDMLGAIHNGPAALEDMRQALADILSTFRPGRNDFLRQIFLGKRVEKILFAATKADHLHQAQHSRLTAIAEAVLVDARARADFAGAETAAMSLAALRTTTEATVEQGERSLDVVRGRSLETGKMVAVYPGRLPDDPAKLLQPARSGKESWLDAEYNVAGFAPQELDLKPGEGPPHIRLDRAAEFLIGDRLR